MKKFTLLMIAIAFSAFAFAQTDFSGTWALNSSKSKLGEMSFAPSKVVITQNASEMSVETTSDMMGETSTRTSKYKLDGTESSNEGFGGNPIKSTAKWSDDKKALTVTTKIDMQGNEMVITAVYKMDGSNLVIENAMGDFGSETQVFDKK